MMTATTMVGSDDSSGVQPAPGEEVGSTGLRPIEPELGHVAHSLAVDLSQSSGRREDTPIRKVFVRTDDDSTPPLTQLVSTRGRGGDVAVKLYLALVWRCSAAPFDTDISARKWAALLDLDDPNHNGARRITAALKRLETLRLIRLEQRRGASSVVTLLDESGDGSKYELPSTAYTFAPENAKSKSRYFKVPLGLWMSGHLQEMSAAALSMLLVLLAESPQPGRAIWWSTDRFPTQYGIGRASCRGRGHVSGGA